MEIIVRSLDLHKDPDSDRWAVSFIYDDKGPDSDDGDIICVGTYEKMKGIYDKNKTTLVDVEYSEALNLLDKEGYE